MRGELEHVPATIFVGLARGGLTELVRVLAISPGGVVLRHRPFRHALARRRIKQFRLIVYPIAYPGAISTA